MGGTGLIWLTAETTVGWAGINTIMNLRAPQNGWAGGGGLLPEEPLEPHERVFPLQSIYLLHSLTYLFAYASHSDSAQTVKLSTTLLTPTCNFFSVLPFSTR